ncbi:MAG TPA: hypothetical protein VFP61_02690 [Acidimicrobiales bacterium]|nr:hypothetical protein [Acidimicrobiales bacterium]
MALAGRSSRSGGGRRLLIAALVVTILVVLLDASLKSRSPAAVETLSAQSWLDRALPVVRASSTDGAELATLRSSGLGQPAARITGTLDAIAADAAAGYRAVVAIGSPPAAGGAPGLLQAALLVRSKAAATLAGAVTTALSAPAPPSGPSDPAVSAAAGAYSQLQVGDQAYALFASSLPKAVLGAPLPPSTWVTDATADTAPALQVWLAALRSGTSLAPTHQLAIESVSTTPPPVGLAGAVQDIPPTRNLTVTVVVADTGNQPEAHLTVTAAVTPAASGTAPSVRDFTSLTPGTATTVTLGPLLPPSGTPATLTVTVTPPAGSPTAPVTSTLQIEVAAPPPPTTTTTLAPAPGTAAGTATPTGASGSRSTTTSTTRRRG